MHDRSVPYAPSLTILGCRVDALDERGALERIEHFVRVGGAHQIVTLGTEMIVYAQHDERYRAIVNACALSLCDTVGLLWASRLRGGPLRERVTGVELADRIAALSARTGARLYLLGGAPGVAAAAATQLAAKYPGVQLAGARDGYFGPDEAATVAAGIAASGAAIVLAALGFPKQEFWLAEHLAASGAAVGIGVGGSLDVLSGYKPRAPRFFRALHLEWLYRLVREPARWRRQLALPRFAWLVLRERMGMHV